MKTVSEARARWIMSIKPGSKIETRDGKTVLVLPTYDINTDTAGEEVLLVDQDSGPKFKPGDQIRHTETGEPFDIVDLPAKLFGTKVEKRQNPDDPQDDKA